MDFWSSENLIPPFPWSMQRIVPFHLPSMTDIAASRQQSKRMCPGSWEPEDLSLHSTGRSLISIGNKREFNNIW